MGKTVCYECDGGCGSRREMAIGQYPQGWHTITLVLRAFLGQQAEGRRKSEDADATTYIHLCPKCRQPENPALVFEKLIEEGHRIPSHTVTITPRVAPR